MKGSPESAKLVKYRLIHGDRYQHSCALENPPSILTARPRALTPLPSHHSAEQISRDVLQMREGPGATSVHQESDIHAILYPHSFVLSQGTDELGSSPWLCVSLGQMSLFLEKNRLC